MYETSTRKSPARRVGAVLAALLVALGALVGQSVEPAEAAFPAANGKIVFQSDRTTGAGVNNPGGDYEIFSMNPDGTGLTQFTDNNGPDSEPAYSAYGNKIVFVRGADVWVMNSNGTGQTRLTYNLTQQSGYDHDPAFSPEGTRIVFSRSFPNTEIYVMDADGSHQRNLSNSPASDHGPVFSPNGARIAFTSDRDGDNEIYKMKADGTGTPINLTNNSVPDEQPDFSPDGRMLTYASYRKGDNEIFTMRPDGTDKVRLTSNAFEDDAPAYSPNGQRLVYGAFGSIAKMKTDGTSRVYLPHADAVNLRPDWQPLKIITAPF